MCFEGYYRTLKEKSNEPDEEERDIFDAIVYALRLGLTYEDLGNMSFVMLSNIADAGQPKKHKPTQAEIDLIT